MYAMQGVEGELEEEPPVLHAFDLALYTEEYKRRASHADVFRGSLDAWYVLHTHVQEIDAMA